MWSIVWNIENKIKHDVLSFSTEAQALKYAQYYKSLLEIHDSGQHMQKRFGEKESSCKDNRPMSISFRLMNKKTTNSLSAAKSNFNACSNPNEY